MNRPPRWTSRHHEVLLLLRELVSEFGVSLLFVTHDFGVVAELRVIYAGQTVEAGRVQARSSISVYAGAAGLPSGSRGVATGHPRHGAVAACRTVRLPLCAALRPGASGMRRSAAAAGASASASAIGRHSRLCGDVTTCQRGNQNLLDIGKEKLAIHRSVLVQG